MIKFKVGDIVRFIIDDHIIHRRIKEIKQEDEQTTLYNVSKGTYALWIPEELLEKDTIAEWTK